ncbi:membrane protein [Streptomyces filipinensis]|uniref:Membrane protein n=2 Tax=Streptomyces filipinensis TaxID=66887 RepID=A0A918IGR0_9ACTN|nr:membrane protein [Streptomyces filipinensis]
MAMEASPRDTAQSAEHVTTEGDEPDRAEGRATGDCRAEHQLAEGRRPEARPAEDLVTGGRPAGHRLAEETLAEARLTDDGPDETPDGVTDDGPEPEEMYPGGPEVEVELRPQRRLRIWQLAPIVGLSAVGSLMFAFPLAFDFGDSGAVIAMLGLLICSCAAGWGMMAARRVGYTWPGLPARGSGRRPDWRVVLGYVLLVAVVVILAMWRVARLR